MVSNGNRFYAATVKDAAVRRYLTSSLGYAEVAAEIGAHHTTLRAWVSKARARTRHEEEEADVKKRRPDDRLPAEKFRLLLEASSLSEDSMGAFLRENGLRDGDLDRWRKEAVDGLDPNGYGPSQARRLRELEKRERKTQKRLKEAQALLVLQKKVAALWGDEDADTTR